MDCEQEFGSAVSLAWKGEDALSFSELISRASQCELKGVPHFAAVLYQTWLQRTNSVYAHAANFNLGVTLSNLGDLVGAEAAYKAAIKLSPGFTHPRLNLGILYERLGRIGDAVNEWKWIQLNGPRHGADKSVVLLAMNHLGRVHENQKQLKLAEEYLTESLMLEPAQPDVLHHWVFLRQKQCAWPVYKSIAGLSLQTMQDATSALAMMSLTDDLQIQLNAANRFVREKVEGSLPPLASGVSYGHKKIRIAYCSSDFCLHPVSMLTVEMFELHNRDHFDVYGFCWSPEDGSSLRKRVIEAMDHFIPIHQLSDADAADLIRSHEIDILIDLQGQTSGARPNMLGRRPAPIQITYLGLPATTGLPSIDYVIADEFLIPKSAAPYYSEKPLYMPHIYQVSDRQRVSAAMPSRVECGLPAQGFVYCSFNNCYKYTAEMFDVWAAILRRVPDSVLWLLADNVWVEENLRREIEAKGVSQDRLIFAPRVSPENYLARYLVADLFLDTFPFNAGTTANDCLWMGCPILTISGQSFGSRMAGAMLTAANLPSLICQTVGDYEDLAVALAFDRDKCLELREHLRKVRTGGTLFDTPSFVRDFESRLLDLVS